MATAWLQYLRDPDPWRMPDPPPRPVTTARTVVRPYAKGDGPALFRAVDETRDALLPHMVWALTEHRDVDDSVHFVEKHRRALEAPDVRDVTMGIFDPATGEVLGGTGLHRIRPEQREAEVGYWVRGDRHGQGLCTEAVGALITSALRPTDRGGWGFRRIVVVNHVDNVASRRVCQKLGLRLEMRMRGERWFGPPGVEPGYADMLGFAVLAEEWDGESHRARPGIGWDD